MVDETRKVIRVEVEAQRAQAQLDALRKSLEDMGIDMSTVSRRIDGMEKSLNRLGQTGRNSSSGIDKAAQSAQRLARAESDLNRDRKRSDRRSATADWDAQFNAASVSADKFAKSQGNIIDRKSVV